MYRGVLPIPVGDYWNKTSTNVNLRINDLVGLEYRHQYPQQQQQLHHIPSSGGDSSTGHKGTTTWLKQR